MELFADVFLDAAIDCIKMLPFLFLAFFLLEALEHRVSGKMNDFLARSGGLGPFVGSVLGFVPQCGFSIMASDMAVIMSCVFRQTVVKSTVVLYWPSELDFTAANN